MKNHHNIPNIIHFIYFGGRKFELINYLSIKSAYEVHKPDHIFIYTDTQQDGEWWNMALNIAEKVDYQAPKTIASRPIIHPAHQADVARLTILHEQGGIYLDLDVISNKSFTSLMHNGVVMGEEHICGKKVGLCSAVILAEKNSPFLQRWLDGFDPETSLWKGFRSGGLDLYYSEMTTKYSAFLANLYPEEIHIEPYTSFFYPSYSENDIHDFYESPNNIFGDPYVYHLWANAVWDSHIKDLTLDGIKNGNSVFHQILKPYI